VALGGRFTHGRRAHETERRSRSSQPEGPPEGAAAGRWSAIEYVLHRFVLHGLQPFRGWHEAHHDRPTALICAPTILSATLIFGLVFVPAWLIGELWRARALTLGVAAGYLADAITHHATHHWRGRSAWLQRRKRWHALHHHDKESHRCDGVTSTVWDDVFASGFKRAAGMNKG
jgi:sterol desaturase/sphingolipid hydroxylase (fatty acid hydroxylase superfamily)